jgi:hypothetical protein
MLLASLPQANLRCIPRYRAPPETRLLMSTPQVYSPVTGSHERVTGQASCCWCRTPGSTGQLCCWSELYQVVAKIVAERFDFIFPILGVFCSSDSMADVFENFFVCDHGRLLVSVSDVFKFPIRELDESSAECPFDSGLDLLTCCVFWVGVFHKLGTAAVWLCVACDLRHGSS